MKHRASEFTYFARQRGSGELDYGSIDGDVPAKSGECADYTIFADHRGFNYLSRGKTGHERDNRACRKVYFRDLIQMQDYLTAMERLRKDAAEAELIRELATEKAKRDFFDRLHRHLNQLADEIEEAMNPPKTA